MEYAIEQNMPKEKLRIFCRNHKIKRLALFGSAIRDELMPDSDIDILVEFLEDNTPGLFELSRMEIELTGILGRQVDLRTPDELSRYFRDEVVRTAETQYEAT